MGANIRLESIAESAFNDFLEAILPPYIEERSAADHVSKTVAEQFAHRQNAELLPRGYHTLATTSRASSTESRIWR